MFSNISTLASHAPQLLSLKSDGLTAEKFPGALGEYELSDTHILPHLVGYSQYYPDRTNETSSYFIFMDLSASTTFVSHKQFSRDPKDLILYHNGTGWIWSWYLMVPTYVGGVEILKNRKVEMNVLRTRHHGNNDDKFDKVSIGIIVGFVLSVMIITCIILCFRKSS